MFAIITPAYGDENMTEIDQELVDHLNRNKEVWILWKENGVNEETTLTVNFHYYATSQDSADALTNAFKEAKLEYRINITKTLFILKGWEIEADVTRTWTLNTLQEVTEMMYKLATDSKNSLEGLGALLDNNT